MVSQTGSLPGREISQEEKVSCSVCPRSESQQRLWGKGSNLQRRATAALA